MIKWLSQRLPARFILGLALLGWPGPLLALDPEKPVSQFICQNWGRQNGLPVEQINAITQSRDGLLWLGTQRGLVRFDSRDFKSVSLESTSNPDGSIRCLSASQTGGLLVAVDLSWFGRLTGAEFKMFQGGDWAGAGHDPLVIRETTDGNFWTGGENGAFLWTAENRPPLASDSGLTNTISLAEGPHGRVWLGTVEHGIWLWQNEKFAPVIDPELTNLIVFSLAEDAQGTVWAGTQLGLRGYSTDLKTKSIPPLNDEVKALLLDREGSLWIGTSGRGLARYKNGQYTFFTKTNGLANDYVTSLFEDREGSLWVGTREGLSQLMDVKFPIFSAADGIQAGSCLAVAPSARGGVWLATAQGISLLTRTGATNLGIETEGITNAYTKRVFEASNSALYRISGSKSIDVLTGGRVLRSYPQSAWPTCFAEDSHGVIAGVGSSLFRIGADKLIPFVYPGGQEPPMYWIYNLWPSRSGALWVASGNGALRIKEGAVQQWTEAQGLSSSRVNWIFEDADGSAWLGLMTGLARIKNDTVKNITRTDGLRDGTVYAIVPDDQGYFWLDCSRGIMRLSRQSLNDFADGKQNSVTCELFDGVRTFKSSDRSDQEPSGCKDSAGRIWFPRVSGALLIDPSRLYTNFTAPSVLIGEILINGAAVRRQDFVLPSAVRINLEFRFQAMSFRAPHGIQVRYRLAGLEPAWISADERRSVLYNNLPPGRYKFEIQAATADGVWNTVGDAFEFQIPTPFYRSDWFLFVCAVAGATLVIGIFKWRMRLAIARQRQLQALNTTLENRVRERTQAIETANLALREEVDGHQRTVGKLNSEIHEREKAERDLVGQRNLLRTLIDTLPDSVFVKDEQCRIVLSNRAYATFLGGLQPDEVVGHRDSDFYPADLAAKSLADERQLLASGTAYHTEEPTVNLATGENRWSFTTKVPIRDVDGRVTGLAGIHRDITDRKQWEARQEALRRELMDASRRAGMAEVATGVLHNVGNVLNSANVSTGLVVERIANSKLSGLPRVVALLREHDHDLGQFLISDPKGRQILPYLENLCTHLMAEQAGLMGELKSLTMNMEHIREIIAMQQANARITGLVEPESLVNIVEDALKIHAVAFQRHAVQVVRDLSPLPPILVDRHKVLQILVNLLQNAKQACSESGASPQMIKVSLRPGVADHAQIVVTDNGIGIRPEILSRIFEHGFTTRREGHGFGLHSAALAALEMGGQLNGYSDGPGKGATFVLDLPAIPPTPSPAD